MSQPKVSVILRAAARGVTALFDPQQMLQYTPYGNPQMSQMQGQPYDSRDYERSKDLAGALNGIAAIYEQIEAETAKSSDTGCAEKPFNFEQFIGRAP